MTANPYQVLGPSIPRMVGRQALRRRIEQHLSKASPDHVSVVGPAYYGKSVLLRHVADAYQQGSEHYLTTVHVDLRHADITSDSDFRRRFADDLRAALRPHRAEVADYLDLKDDSIHDLLGAVFDDLAAEPARVLVVFDGFDHVLAQADLTRTLLGALWDDCDLELREDLAALAGADVARADLSPHRLRAVEDRGFGRVTGTRLRSACRLMQRYAAQQAPAIANLKRLFGSVSGFEAHIRSALEMRLEQVVTPRTNRLLRDLVSRAVRDLDDNPEFAVNGVRAIATRALELVWEAELPPDKTIPSEWLEEWRHAGEKFRDDRGKLPRGYGAQCNILRLATGTGGVESKTRYVRKTTCLLIDHLQSVGDFGQHRADFPKTHVTVGFGAAVVLAAIALVESLTADLQREQEFASKV